MLGGARKNSDFDSRVFLKDTRKMWELFLNEKLLEKGIEEVFSETLEKQNIKREPRKKMNLWNKENEEEYEKLKKAKALFVFAVLIAIGYGIDKIVTSVGGLVIA